METSNFKKDKMRVCEYRHDRIKNGIELQIRLLRYAGELRRLSEKQLMMMGADYALTFLQSVSEYNPEDFCDLLCDDCTTKYVVAVNKDESPVWTRRIIKGGQWVWENPSASSVTEWIPICGHISISSPDD